VSLACWRGTVGGSYVELAGTNSMLPHQQTRDAMFLTDATQIRSQDSSGKKSNFKMDVVT